MLYMLYPRQDPYREDYGNDASVADDDSDMKATKGDLMTQAWYNYTSRAIQYCEGKYPTVYIIAEPPISHLSHSSQSSGQTTLSPSADIEHQYAKMAIHQYWFFNMYRPVDATAHVLPLKQQPAPSTIISGPKKEDTNTNTKTTTQADCEKPEVNPNAAELWTTFKHRAQSQIEKVDDFMLKHCPGG